MEIHVNAGYQNLNLQFMKNIFFKMHYCQTITQGRCCPTVASGSQCKLIWQSSIQAVQESHFIIVAKMLAYLSVAVSQKSALNEYIDLYYATMDLYLSCAMDNRMLGMA